jgi:hypothetical protein
VYLATGVDSQMGWISMHNKETRRSGLLLPY